MWQLLALAASLCAPALAAQTSAPVFPFGLYDKAEMAPGSAAWRAYYAMLLDVLAQNNINTLLVQPYREVATTLEVMDAARARGLHVIMSVGNPLNPHWDYIGPRRPFFPAYRHPAVIAFKYGDEPDDDADLDILQNAYGALRRHVRPPVVTVMVGEQMRFVPDEIASRAWSSLRAPVRAARFYPLRKTYDLQRWPRDKMTRAFDAWAREMELAAETPWWYVAQAFGQGTAAVEQSYWRLPTAAETTAMLHIALANGARGVIGYAAQDHSVKFIGLVDEHLHARRAWDGSQPLHAWRDLGALVSAHAGLLSRHRRADFVRDVSGDDVVAIARIDPQDGAQYVYIVNKNTQAAATGVLQVAPTAGRAFATDVYAREPRAQALAAEGTLSWSLAPGEGKLLKLSHE